MLATHKSLKAWQTAHGVVMAVLGLDRTYWRPQLRSIFDQLLRASLSVQINIAEGYAAGPGRRCTQYYRIAYGSAVEAGDLLELLEEIGTVPRDSLEPIIGECGNCQRLLRGLIRKSRASHPASP